MPYWSAFPTGVGVNRIQNMRTIIITGIPHRRGGEPSSVRSSVRSSSACIPHRRGGEPHITVELQNRLPHSPQAWG